MDRTLGFIKAEALDNAGQPQTVITVKMGETDMGDGRCRQIRIGHLSLCPFAGIEQKSTGIPTKEIAIVIAVARGYLGCGAKYDEFSHVFLL